MLSCSKHDESGFEPRGIHKSTSHLLNKNNYKKETNRDQFKKNAKITRFILGFEIMDIILSLIYILHFFANNYYAI